VNSRRAWTGAVVALTALVAGCGAAPGGSSSNDTAKKSSTPAASVAATPPDISKVGNVTLTVWDQEVRGGQNKQMKQLIGEFEAKYPNV
jgi:raffinose/stachyose/melibiose transport system substrate-binding protein